jgi:hypothetical protein
MDAVTPPLVECFRMAGESPLSVMLRQLRAEFEQAFGTPPGWAVRPVGGPPALCLDRPVPQGVSLRVRPGAYAGPLPLNRQAREFLAGWTHDRGLYFDGEVTERSGVPWRDVL